MKDCNILIVEDHALTRFALLTSLKDESFAGEVLEAETAEDAYKILENNNIDIILMDLGLPDTDGVSATIQIKKKYPEIKIIVITSHTEEKEAKACIEAGINAFCSKDIKPEKLIELIKDVLNGSVWFDSSAAKVIMQKASNKNAEENAGNGNKNCYNLTTKEMEVLRLLADGNSNIEIAKKLNISINTTKVHMCAILQKLSVDDRTQAAIKAIRENLT